MDFPIWHLGKWLSSTRSYNLNALTKDINVVKSGRFFIITIKDEPEFYVSPNTIFWCKYFKEYCIIDEENNTWHVLG